MKRLTWRMLGCVILGLWLVNLAQGSAKARLARETAEYVVRKFGKQAAQEGTESLGRRIEGLAVRHGDEVFLVARKLGPRSLHLVEEAGEHGGIAVKLLGRYGDEAVWVVARRERLVLCARYGDDAATALMKHGEGVEPLVEAYGSQMVMVLKGVSPQNGRRLAMMHEEGQLAKTRRGQDLLALVGGLGERGMDYIWDHRLELQSEEVLKPFLDDPCPYLEGQRRLPSPSSPTTLLGEKVAAGVILLAVVIFLGRAVLRQRRATPS